MEIAYHYDDNGYYTGKLNRQLDPLESKIQGKPVYLIPGSSTLKKPLKEKEGFKIKFDSEKDKWVYEKELEKEEEKPYEPTELDNLQLKLAQVKYELSQLDYIGTKIATGRATKEEYSAEIAKMNELAEEINDLNEKIKALQEK